MMNIKHLLKKMMSRRFSCMLACGAFLLASSGIARAAIPAPIEADYDVNGITLVVTAKGENRPCTLNEDGIYEAMEGTVVRLKGQLSRIPSPKNEWKYVGFEMKENTPDGPMDLPMNQVNLSEMGIYLRSLLAAISLEKVESGATAGYSSVEVHTPPTDVVFLVRSSQG